MSCSQASHFFPTNSRSIVNTRISSGASRARTFFIIRWPLCELPRLVVFWQDLPANGQAHAIENDSDHEDVDVSPSELPIGAIHRKNPYGVHSAYMVYEEYVSGHLADRGWNALQDQSAVGPRSVKQPI